MVTQLEEAHSIQTKPSPIPVISVVSAQEGPGASTRTSQADSKLLPDDRELESASVHGAPGSPSLT
jgi:hypothetical protein